MRVFALLPIIAWIILNLSSANAWGDMLLVGGRVWTADSNRPWAEAIAIRGDRIVFVGSSADARRLPLRDPEVIELRGRLVLPGMNDAHAHLLSGAVSLGQVDLGDSESLSALQAQIEKFAIAHPDTPWVLGRGWTYGAFDGGLPTKQQLDAVVGDRPAYMTAYDGHSGWANSTALAMAGITKDSIDPDNGVIVRDPVTGEPTGALKESARGLVTRRIPELSEEARFQLLVQALALLNSKGTTSLQDASFSVSDLPLLQRALEEGRLTLRFRGALRLEPGDAENSIAEAVRLKESLKNEMFTIDAVKAFVDGVVESKTAAMLTAYPGTELYGHPNWEPEALNAAVVAADKAGLQVWLHAIGDRAVRMSLDAHEAAALHNGPRDRRGRIEHIETIHPMDYPRFRQLGVMASMQPLHANPNQNMLEIWTPNAGPDRASRAFGWRNLEQSGARVIFGSDWPVVTADSLRGLFCAVTRKTTNGEPVGGWIPEQAVPLEHALRHYTIDAAYGSFEEAHKGSIETGKLADVIVLSEDIFEQPPAKILETRVVLTILGGVPVFRE